MRELKQRFTQWFNKKAKRKGPLWNDRFKSVLLENDQTVLLTMAAYIDLNPVRAGLVNDPKDYRWSGYGEAVAGNKARRAGLMRIYGDETGDGRKWRGYQAQYRLYLYAVGEVHDSEIEKRQAGLNSKVVDLFHRKSGPWKPRVGRRGVCEEPRETQSEARTRSPPIERDSPKDMERFGRSARMIVGVLGYHAMN